MFMDEASFGRISSPVFCWCPEGVRPTVPSQRIREYVYVYGAADPIDGEKFFIIAPSCSKDWTELFIQKLSIQYPNDYIILVADNASWHKTQGMKLPSNIKMAYIPPYTPEMNPIEQVWRELRTQGFKNVSFLSLEEVVDKLCEVIKDLTAETIKSIMGRKWIKSIFK